MHVGIRGRKRMAMTLNQIPSQFSEQSYKTAKLANGPYDLEV